MVSGLLRTVAVLVALVAAGGAIKNRLLFSISDAEKEYVTKIWNIYVGDLKAEDDILGVIISLFQEKVEVASMIHEKFNVELKIEPIRQLAHYIKKIIHNFLNDVLRDDNEALKFVRGYADLFHSKDIPIESILLYPLGILASKIAGRTKNPDSGEIFTRFSFGIAAVLCGPMSPTGFNGIDAREQALILNAWARYLETPTNVETLVATSYATLPDLAKLSPELNGMTFDEGLTFRTSNNFRTFLNDKLLKFTNWLKNLHNKKASQEVVVALATAIDANNISMVTVFFGSIILLIKQMKDTITDRFNAETERAFMKLAYTNYPLVLQVQKYGQIAPNGTVIF